MSEGRVTLTLGVAGACQHPEGMVLRHAPWRAATFPAMYALIEHPREGLTLYDTGYAEAFLRETSPFPARLYRWLTPVTLGPRTSAAAQLRARGVDPREVRRVVLSHFHADHIAGARDFTEARFVASREAYASVSAGSAFAQLVRGFLPGLLPDDFLARVDFIEARDFNAQGVGEFHSGFDLFGDRSVTLIGLPGHAAGQLGALVQGAEGKRHLLVADAAWTTASFKDNRPSHPLAGLIMDAPSQARTTLAGLHRLSQADPALDIIPSHCRFRLSACA